KRNLHLHMLAGFEALDGLAGVHLCRCGQDHGIQARLPEAFGEITRVMRDAELLRHLTRGFLVAAGECDHLDARNVADRLQVLDAEGTLPSQTYFHLVYLER